MPALGPGPATFEEHTIMITRADQIRTALSALQPVHLEVIDESHIAECVERLSEAARVYVPASDE